MSGSYDAALASLQSCCFISEGNRFPNTSSSIDMNDAVFFRGEYCVFCCGTTFGGRSVICYTEELFFKSYHHLSFKTLLYDDFLSRCNHASILIKLPLMHHGPVISDCPFRLDTKNPLKINTIG